ncbi:Protein of unknown function DUF4504 [Dillenia turbinata]|uniref:Uncharacterized protein n=1 Tax=Dillenia turbinata TaxID=194707 RepID=A0AAN8URW2_9MAGN
MDTAQVDEALQVLDSGLSHIKWRLKSSARRRLHTDILALCTRMRPVIMVDYGGKMPELQERLCALLIVLQKASSTFQHLKVMVIEEMIYLVHVRGFAEHINSSLNAATKLLFVDLEQDPPKMVSQEEKSPLLMQLVSIYKSFSSVFPVNEVDSLISPSFRGEHEVTADVSGYDLITSASSEYVDLSSCIQESQVTVPTLNGWLLGYPVVYLFGKEHIADAIYNLSTKALHLFQITVSRNATSSKGSLQEELLSFSVPYELSIRGSKEPWAEAFLAHMQTKWNGCNQVWRALKLEVSECYPQAIVL